MINHRLELINKDRNMTTQLAHHLPPGNGVPEPRGTKNSPVTPYLNFERLRCFGELVLKFDKFRQNNANVITNVEEYFPSSSVSAILGFINNLPTFEDDKLWEMTLKCEPE